LTHDPAVTPEPDLLQEVLRRIQAHAPQLDAAALERIETEIRRDLGGERVRIAKRRKQLSTEQRQELFDQAIAGRPEQDLTLGFRISRATLYRQIKRGRP
jgi:hypothetical protein